MKNITTIFLFFILSVGISQEYHFKPQWKKGTVKHISMTQVEKEYEDEQLTFDTTKYNEAQVKVLKENKTFYTLEVLFENQALTAAIEFYDQLGEELKDYKDLKLVFTVNKKTAETELQNWEEAQDFMENSFKQISTVLEQKAPDVAPLMGMVFMPLKQLFKSQENIEAYMMNYVGYLFVPFNQDFQLGETTKTIATEANPLNPLQEISTTTLLTLETVDEESNSCILSQEIIFDLSEFMEMMKNMVQKMSKSVGVNDSISAKASQEFDEFKMEMKNIQTITYNSETTWVTKVVAKSLVEGVDPQKGIKNKRETVMTTIIK